MRQKGYTERQNKDDIFYGTDGEVLLNIGTDNSANIAKKVGYKSII